jgi:hypothetical protein
VDCPGSCQGPLNVVDVEVDGDLLLEPRQHQAREVDPAKLRLRFKKKRRKGLSGYNSSRPATGNVIWYHHQMSQKRVRVHAARTFGFNSGCFPSSESFSWAQIS